MLVFNRHELRPGLLVSVYSDTPAGKLISAVLQPALDKLGPEIKKLFPKCPNHDAIIIKKDGNWFVGDTRPLISRLTPIETYERHLNDGSYSQLRILAVKEATEAQERAAADYWMEDVNGTFYDFFAYPRLFFKAIFQKWNDTIKDWEWAHWCTSGTAEAYREGAKLDVYRKLEPTPYTTIKRVMDGTLVDVTNIMVYTLTEPVSLCMPMLPLFDIRLVDP